MIAGEPIMSESKLLQLNLGCGTGKIPDFINIDIDEALKPDQVFDVRGSFPLDDNSCQLVTMYHTIEHIEKGYWQGIFLEIGRVLKEGGHLWLTFPEYPIVWEYWKKNHRGMREFWEACMFGRGASVHDRHVAASSIEELRYWLLRSGFQIDYAGPEGVEMHNSLIRATNLKPVLYKDVLRDAVWQPEKNYVNA